LLGSAAVLPLQPAAATVDEQSALAAYVRARAADSIGAYDQAVRDYRIALALSPEDSTLAARALNEGLAAGDRPLAVSAARVLEKGGKLRVDGRLLLLGEALRTRDWRSAATHIDRIEEDEVFSFLSPLFRAWVAQGSRKGDPIVILAGINDNPLAATYAAEQKAFLLLATGKRAEGVAALGPVLAQAGARAPRLRVAAAAILARKDKAAALTLLQGDSEPLVLARTIVESGKPLPGAIDDPASGAAELLVRIAVDLNSQQVPALALDFARLGTFMAPDNSEAWIVTSELLAAADQHRAALAALDSIPAGDPFAGSVEDSRIGLLLAAGRRDEALALAKGETEAQPRDASSWTRLGDLLNQTARPGDAADAYGKALALVRADPESDSREWPLLLRQGGALAQAGRWTEGKSALEAAYKLAPDEPLVLNYLGYSQLERRENVAEAERLIREASRLQPDNMAITDSLGWAHFLRGDLPAAITLLERAAQGQPADPSIKEHLGDAYFQAGRRYEARYAWQAALVHAEGGAIARLNAKVDAGLRPELSAP
jgi:tetratricopeptide (TPR) repeat protein